MSDTKSKTVTDKLKAYFIKYGILDIVFSENGHQFSSEDFKLLATKQKFGGYTSFPA